MIKRFLKRILSRGRKEEQSAESVQELRAAFTHRYHNFKLLLTANNKALEIMTDIEKALQGSAPFGMSFVRFNSTAACVNVFRIVKHIDELAPGKYSELFNRFKIIQDNINTAVASRKILQGDRLVIALNEIDRDMADQVGNKVANVAEIGNTIQLPVPPGFAVSALAYEKFIEHNDLQSEIDRRIQAANPERMDDLYKLSAGIQQLIIRSSLPDDLERAIMDAYRKLERQARPGITVSLRSSALGEDAAGTSFAGQFSSKLNVSPDEIIDAYKEVIASKYSLQAVTYRMNRGIPDEDVAMCVGCMVMIDAAAGGVAYSANPLNIRDRSIYIDSAWGLPKAVVDGTVDPDLIVVSRNGQLAITRKQIQEKEYEFQCFPEEGVCRVELTGDRKALQSISDDTALKLADMVVRLEEYYGSPQDIEWAVTADGSLYILQCRPLQQLAPGNTTRGETAVQEGADSILTRGGVTTSPGVASGPVFIVRSDADKLNFPPGAVLVTAQSLPRWAPLLSSAAAVVTELGGVAGHLANVAREFGVPALFGIAGLTNTLKNDDVVTVDADGLTIYAGRVESLLALQKPRKNLMEGSPIYDILETAASHIVPLNLLDPDSPSFHPKKCETLHDITRFCHEKAVHEMFDFGKEHRFSERSSKQLVCGVPMQWWIINLDDGFKEDVDGKFVQLDNIRSVPMLALWEGVIAVPWEGPPPVDTKGFMSILVQATTNTALETSMASPYSARNYFMLSRNFCSLTSRFGFHFSTVEALVGERPSENYISFAFKGGAADLARKIRRAHFVGNILEEFGFRVEVKEDSAFARIEGHDEEYMKEMLRILGYLIIHTRQLDMVMNNDASIQKYRTKILDDIHSKVKKSA
jgi:pyruvate, water dikinase